jgi:hypothetical protein
MKRRAAIVGPMATLLAASRARAEMFVDLALVLAVAVSRSIDEVEAELQRRGYIEALTSRAVIDAILSGENRHIALCYVEWPEVAVIDWTTIDSEAAARRFAERLAESPRTSQSWTAVGARHRHQRPAGDDESREFRPARRSGARQILRGKRHRRTGRLHRARHHLRRFRSGGARQAGPRNLRRGGPAYARLNGAIFLSPRRSKQHHPAPMPGGSDRCWPTIR